jgi:hypothetical protein
MTSTEQVFQQQAKAVAQLASQLVTKSGGLWADAAEKSDTAQGLGINERINLLHNLVDIWVKGYAGLLQTVLTNPGATPSAAVPIPSQEIRVPAVSWERTISADGAFTREGIGTETIPPADLKFSPSTLKPNETTFTIEVTNYDYLGANYAGQVVLNPADAAATAAAAAAGAGAQPHREAVTVAL